MDVIGEIEVGERLVAEVNTNLAVERTSGFLEREVIVELGIGEVATFYREVISSVSYRIRERQIMRELVRDYVVVLIRSQI
jgi:hypothetical protein